MAKKDKNEVFAFLNKDPKGSYFSPRKTSSGIKGKVMTLKKFDPKLRKHVTAVAVNKSKRVASK